MNTLSKLSFLTLALTLGACNEKVSPELQGAASSTTTGGDAVAEVPESFYFRVANNADTMLNFKLHKTGSGNANTNCEVSNNFGLSSDAYRADTSTYDITCFMEAEELSLRFNGLDFNIEASKNTCEYLGYAPYSYYDKQPGDSTGSYSRVTCAAGVTQPMLAALGVTQTCNTYISTSSGGAGVAFPMSTAAETSLCRFNYDGQLCDTGTVSVTEQMFTLNAGPDEIPGTVDDFAVAADPTDRQIICGGKTVACIDGPIKLTDITGTSGITIEKSELNKEFESNKVLPKIIGIYNGSRRYVNYRRDLASFNIEYGNSDKPLSATYLSSWGDPTYKNTYNPELVSYYSRNMRMDGTDLVGTAPILEAGRYNIAPAAADPFIGIGSQTNPFYTFYCMDNAYDVKARIRMVVRDWDRVLPVSASSTYFERVSDVDLLPPFARQDVPYTDEVTGDPDSWNAFNDVGDWDDLIEMERDDAGTTYDPSITIWRPLPDGTYTTGFWNPAWFPSDI